MSAFDQARSNGKPVEFDRLTLSQYIEILLAERRWEVVKQHVQIDRERLKEHLSWVREIRNDLAHFRRELTDEEKDRLKWTQSLLHRPRDRAAARKVQSALEGLGDPEGVDPAAEVMDP